MPRSSWCRLPSYLTRAKRPLRSASRLPLRTSTTTGSDSPDVSGAPRVPRGDVLLPRVCAALWSPSGDPGRIRATVDVRYGTATSQSRAQGLLLQAHDLRVRDCLDDATDEVQPRAAR